MTKQRLGVRYLAMVLFLGAVPAADVSSLDFDKTDLWDKPSHHENEFSGTVEFVDGKNEFITVKNGEGKMQCFYATSDSRITKEDKRIALRDLRVGDTIELIYHCEEWGDCIYRAKVLVKREPIRSTI